MELSMPFLTFYKAQFRGFCPTTGVKQVSFETHIWALCSSGSFPSTPPNWDYNPHGSGMEMDMCKGLWFNTLI